MNQRMHKHRGKRKLSFVRYGGLSSVRQEGYDPAMPGFHSPPARRGIYAFVEQTVYFFLIGGETFDSRRNEWLRNSEGERIRYDDDTHDQALPERQSCEVRLASDGVAYLARHKKPKTFTHDGEVWHHLEVPRHLIIQSTGTWNLTTAHAHREAFHREFHKRSYALRQTKAFHPTLLLDNFEVFIEKV